MQLIIIFLFFTYTYSQDYSLSFDGVNDYVTLSNPIMFSENSFTVSIDCSLNDFQGREIATLINGNMKAGYHSITWNASANASGIYFVKMISGEYISTQKLILIK